MNPSPERSARKNHIDDCITYAGLLRLGDYYRMLKLKAPAVALAISRPTHQAAAFAATGWDGALQPASQRAPAG
jgi:hypothetical protein